MNLARHPLSVLLAIGLLLSGARAFASLTWTYNAAEDVPVTASGYTATGAATLTLNFAPPAGTTLIVVRNTGPGFINGTFNNLVQGQAVKLTFNGINYNFVASYHGGTGNDLVLHWANVRPVSWGYNEDGQLGTGNTSQPSQSELAPVKVVTGGVLAGKTIVSLVAGNSHSVALCSDGTLAAWGGNLYGQLGNGSPQSSLVPVAVNASGALAGKTVVSIAAGAYHTLALCSDGSVVAWGRNFEGQLGNGTQDNGLVPVPITANGALAGRTVTGIAAGNSHSLVLCSDGKIFSWGENDNGQLGDVLYLSSLVPIPVDASGVLAGRTAVAITAGYYFSLVLCSDGALVGWGYNAQGQLGDNGTTNRFGPVLSDTSGVLAGKTIASLTAGGFHTLALCTDGTLAVWGDNSYGGLGITGFSQRRVPALMDSPSLLTGKIISQVSAGRYHSFARCTDGSLLSWGYHAFGQLGIGQLGGGDDGSDIPLAVNGSMNAVYERFGAAASGPAGYHSLGLVASLPVPVVNDLAVSGLTSATATLHATVNPNANASTAKFEYGPTANYENNATVTLSPDDGTAAQAVSAGITSLAPHTLYHYRLTATNAAGTVSTSDGTFTTLFTDADLASLAMNPGSLGQVFRSDLVAYSPTVAHSAGSVTVTPSAAVDGATIKVNNTAVASGSSSGALSLNVGPNLIVIEVTAPGGATLTYTITVTRLPVEMQLRGLGVPIASGDQIPGAQDGTDFGSVSLLNAQQTRTFTIHNGAAQALNLTGAPRVAITGPAAGDFKITMVPSASIAAGGSSSFNVQFDPKFPGLRQAVLSIAYDESGGQPYTFAIAGFGAPSARLAQSIVFTAPATVYAGQSPLTLSAYAASGLPVTLSVVSGPASMAGNVLTLNGTGTVKVQATQAGNGLYNAAPPLTRTLTVKINPGTLTLLNLSQTYDGTPRAISTLGAAGPVDITYLVGGSYRSAPPVNAASYAVKAVADGVTKAGTLVIARAPLFVTPDDQRKFAGKPNPSELPVSYAGFAAGDTDLTAVSKKPVVKTTATASSPGGQYPITASGAVTANYQLIYRRGTFVVESFAGAYETLLVNADSWPEAKLRVLVAANSTKFTGALSTPWETSAVSLAGTVDTDSSNERATGTATVTSKAGSTYDITFTTPLVGMGTAGANRNAVTLGSAADLRKRLALPKGQTVSYSGAHTAHMQPATPAGVNAPAGAGWSTASISATGVLTLAGRLGDDTSFSATLEADAESNPGYCFFSQPYTPARTGSYMGGKFALLPHPDISGRRYVPGVNLIWSKAARLADVSYRAGFELLTSVFTLDPWLPPVAATRTVPATTLPQRLGLPASGGAFAVQHTATASAAHGNLPTTLAMSSTGTVSVTAPVTVPANSTKWKATIKPSTGYFYGSFELIDDPHKRPVSFTGVLRQPASTSPDAAIGDGHYLLPALPGVASNEKVTGEILLERP